MRLPVLFVCEDNDLAVHTFRRDRHGFRSLGDVAHVFDCAVFETDTTDVEELYALATQAVELVRGESSPALLHLKCYRYLEHVGINEDFEVGYRPRGDFEQWNQRDSVLTQRSRLLQTGVSEDYLRKLESDIERRIEDAIRAAKAAPFPTPDELYLGVFHEN